MSSASENILVRGVNWLGDSVMTTPALQRLREARPDACISLLTHEKLADLWRGHPSIDRVMTFAESDSVWSVARRLRVEKFDTALVFPNSARAALEVFFAGISRRVGYAGNLRSVFLTQAAPRRQEAVRMHKRSRVEIEARIRGNVPRETFPAIAHHVHDYLLLASKLGGNPASVPPLLHVGEEEAAAIRTRFRLPGSSPLFALNPGAEYGAAKRWPAERFIEAAVQLHERTKCHWLIVGGHTDADPGARIASQIEAGAGHGIVTNATGKTSLRELCAALKASAVVLTNDTGPMHLAAAVGTPVVVPFGSTAPELTGPSFGARPLHQLVIGSVPCAPCFLRECPIDFRCMNSITVEQVVAATQQAWQMRGGQ
jgi:heptosyltransferase II